MGASNNETIAQTGTGGYGNSSYRTIGEAGLGGLEPVSSANGRNFDQTVLPSHTSLHTIKPADHKESDTPSFLPSFSSRN